MAFGKQKPAAGRASDRTPGVVARPAGGAGGEAAGTRREARSEAKLIAASFRADGRLFDLAAMVAADIDWADAAMRLSRLVRWNGARDSLSIGQHSVMGADALFHETGDGVLAGYFLLHDVHEHLIGDQTRPATLDVDHYAKAVLIERGVEPKNAAGVVTEAMRRSKAAKDAVVWQAASLPPIDRMPAYARQVRDMDERMLRAEGLALFGRDAAAKLPAGHLPPPRLTGPLKPWGPMKAEEAFLDRLEKYLGIVARLA